VVLVLREPEVCRTARDALALPSAFALLTISWLLGLVGRLTGEQLAA
jgi:hypothetical protein